MLLAEERMDVGQPKPKDTVYSETLISKVSFSSKILWFIHLFPSQHAIDANKYSLRTSNYF